MNQNQSLFYIFAKFNIVAIAWHDAGALFPAHTPPAVIC